MEKRLPRYYRNRCRSPQAKHREHLQNVVLDAVIYHRGDTLKTLVGAITRFHQNPRLGNSDPTLQSLRVLTFYSRLGAYGMTPEERARMEYLCKRITVEKNSLKLEQLSLELNDLVSATLKGVQKKPKQRATQSHDPSNRADFSHRRNQANTLIEN